MPHKSSGPWEAAWLFRLWELTKPSRVARRPQASQ